jgi:pyrroloquinoline-quinone synthase
VIFVIEPDVVKEICASYADHPGFRHEFWTWFAEGGFDIVALRRFALAYYQHVRHFRLHIAGALTIAPSEELQTVLAENLADEYGIPLAERPVADSHPEMFRKFMYSLGLTAADWDNAQPITGIRRFHEIHFALFRGGLVSETLGAVVFGMESSTPYRHSMVIDGINRFCKHSGIVVDAAFFETHVSGDEEHGAALMSSALPFIEADPDGVMRGVHLSFDARKVFLDDLACEIIAAPTPGA